MCIGECYGEWIEVLVGFDGGECIVIDLVVVVCSFVVLWGVVW